MILCLLGPTASGKTDLTLSLAKKFPIELISVDSALIYKGMDIGTAKPTPAERAACPHHLIDILTPVETYSAADFVSQAKILIEAILKRGNTPVLVGGTMLYFHALQQGLSILPPSNPAVRQDIEALAAQSGWEAIHQQLQQVDPVSAARIHPQDPQRLCRALEVYRLTGQPLSLLQAQSLERPPYQFMNALLCPMNRAWLHERIATRFDQMIKQGLVAEVESLLSKWPDARTKPAMRSVGYRQVILYLDGKLSYDDMIERGIIATRQLAKRQCTWLRSWPEGVKLDPEDKTTCEKEIERLIKSQAR
ncbi:MAG: tRNA (adenosine(37)-N6)-dimethylallyltransferase MiaA [Gammaproteobacteria bacterium]|nr:tRNA (adenosine(37)-N6)-dimethylallyltransferase MiaA [Gammaproteobacteria bacterium]